ncbi:hypothetical protein TIFTF001_000171 [Ficus carica]|uniref:Uncharacterized protein n=1 Tax=Ficus carica TaxID=3494 RepID=A0AA87YUQ6_FICCA|nr:hypothetical protein TIFTF001_000171 [Ficus carica]
MRGGGRGNGKQFQAVGFGGCRWFGVAVLGGSFVAFSGTSRMRFKWICTETSRSGLREGGEAEGMARVEFAGRLWWRVIPTRCRVLAGMVANSCFGPRQSSSRSSHRIDVDGRLSSFGCSCGSPLFVVVVSVEYGGFPTSS